MRPSKTSKDKKKIAMESTKDTGKKVCFVISPIGKEGTDLHNKFKDILEYVIKNAVKASGYDLDVLRADDIDRSGSFIKDILENLYTSFVVIADLTGQNPNVFYELGVRHALKSRTILIAQSVDDIPSDLREYRTIVYDTSAKGATDFAKRLKGYLAEMHKTPDRPDNPVLDRIGGVIENRLSLLETENQNLKKELADSSKANVSKQGKRVLPDIYSRVYRILQLMGAERQSFGGSYHRGDESYHISSEQGNFKLYFVMDGENIEDFLFLSIRPDLFDYKDDLADARVLMNKCIQQGGIWCKFIVATDMDLSEEHKDIYAVFNKMKEKIPSADRRNFSLEVWDNKGMIRVEKDLGLKV